MPVTRGFFRKRPDGPEGRLPPGQYDTGAGWPVLTAEATPRLDTATWTMTVDGLVETPTTWTWDEIHALPRSTFTGDIHCVTTWSKFDTVFGGVSVDVLLEAAGPRADARFVMAHSTTGYTTNLPLEDLTGGKAWVVWDFNGQPLQREHGGPVRLLVPHLYFWKSAKWVTRLELMAEDRPGFWEQNGYHDRGDPWLEQRYQGDCVTAIDDVTPRPTAWTTGIIIEKDLPTPTTVRLRMHVEDRQRHRPGQHYLIRLRAPDDYTAQRSYSVASARRRPAGRVPRREAAGRRGLGVPGRRGRGR